VIKLYLDDIRSPCDDSFVVVRSVKEAIGFVLENGMPDFISFDHDLGCSNDGQIYPSGYDFVKWLVEADMSGAINISDDFSFAVHSQNPVGTKNIEALLNGYLLFRRKERAAKIK
jgi:hypothetical protein